MMKKISNRTEKNPRPNLVKSPKSMPHESEKRKVKYLRNVFVFLMTFHTVNTFNVELRIQDPGNTKLELPVLMTLRGVVSRRGTKKVASNLSLRLIHKCTA